MKKYGVTTALSTEASYRTDSTPSEEEMQEIRREGEGEPYIFEQLSLGF